MASGKRHRSCLSDDDDATHEKKKERLTPSTAAPSPLTSSSGRASLSDDDDDECCRRDDDDGDAEGESGLSRHRKVRTGPVKELPPASPEQICILNDFERGKNIQILAVAGAGKSTSLLACAQRVPEKTCLVLTYNKRLQVDVSNRIEECGIDNTHVRTYHSAAGIAFGQVIRTDTQFIEALRKEPENLRALYCDVLMLDEVQDMSVQYYLFVQLLVETLPTVQVLIVGDPWQSIYQFLGSRHAFLTQCAELPGFNGRVKRGWVTHELKTSYRLTPAMATFVNRHVLCKGGALIGGNVGVAGAATAATGERYGVPEYCTPAFSKIAPQLNQCIRKAAADFGGYDKVAVIAPTVKPLKQANSKHPLGVLLREFLIDVPLFIARDDEALDEKAMHGKLSICTWNSMKGCERDCVIVMNFDESYFQYYNRDWTCAKTLPNIMYVAVTRARKRLIMFADAKQTLRTFDMRYLSADTTCVRMGVSAPRIELKQTLRSSGSGEDNEPRPLPVSELLRHLEPSVVALMMTLIKVVRDIPMFIPRRSAVYDIAFTRPSVSSSSAPATYTENVAFLYSLVLPALLELDMTGRTPFGEAASVPTIVQPWIEQRPDPHMAAQYTLTQAAYDSFPGSFWAEVKNASSKKNQSDRTWIDWFRLAMAEAAFQQNAHHTARQVSHYEWIDADFLEETRKCMQRTVLEATRRRMDDVPTADDGDSEERDEETRRSLKFRFGVEVHKEVSHTPASSPPASLPSSGPRRPTTIREFFRGSRSTAAVAATATATVVPITTVCKKYMLTSRLHMVINDTDIWLFKLAEKPSDDHFLQLACQMAIVGVKRGYLYLLLSGRVVTVEVADPSRLLRVALGRYDAQIIGDLQGDIDKWRILHGVSIGTTTTTITTTLPEPLR